MVDATRARLHAALGRRAPSAGFTYLWVLLMVAVLGIGLAALGRVWTTAAQREREQELLFIGEQFRRAIGSYYERTPGPAKQYPARIEDLLEDRRFPQPQRHLRKNFPDPMTGRAEWGLVPAANKTIMGIYSKARGTPLITATPRFITPGGPGYGAWQFIYTPGTDPVPVAQSAGGIGSSVAGLLPGAAPAAASAPAPSVPTQSKLPQPAAAAAPTQEKPSDCVIMRAADRGACTRLAADPKAFELCRPSSNPRYGTCR